MEYKRTTTKTRREERLKKQIEKTGDTKNYLYKNQYRWGLKKSRKVLIGIPYVKDSEVSDLGPDEHNNSRRRRYEELNKNNNV